MPIAQNTTSLLTQALLADLLAAEKPPCISLYQATHRRHPDNEQDPIRFKNLLKELESSLQLKYPTCKIKELLQPLQALVNRKEFWDHTLDGLAILASVEKIQIMKLQQKVRNLAIVADTFHTKPLRRYLQTADRYQVLGLSLDKVRLFEGNHHVLDEIDLAPEVPQSMIAALGEELTEPHQTVASYGGVGGSSTPMRHGHGDRKEERDIDARKFFTAVDRAITEHYSRPSRVPLILASLSQHHHLFHEVSQNPFLIKESINYNPDTLAHEELHTLSWALLEPQYHKRIEGLAEAFKYARSKGAGSDNLTEVAEAAVAARISVLLVEEDRLIPGKINQTTGQVEFSELKNPDTDDLLDDLADIVASRAGEVLVIPSDQMPTTTGLAATYRF